MAAAGAFEYLKTNSRNGNKEELYFTFFYFINQEIGSKHDPQGGGKNTIQVH